MGDGISLETIGIVGKHFSLHQNLQKKQYGQYEI